MGTTYLAGGALGGQLVDAYGSYGVPFLVSGALGQLASLTFLFVSTARQASVCSGPTASGTTVAAVAVASVTATNESTGVVSAFRANDGVAPANRANGGVATANRVNGFLNGTTVNRTASPT